MFWSVREPTACKRREHIKSTTRSPGKNLTMLMYLQIVQSYIMRLRETVNQ